MEEHLRSEAPQLAPFRTALLRLRLSDETQVGRGGSGLAPACQAFGACLGSWGPAVTSTGHSEFFYT